MATKKVTYTQLLKEALSDNVAEFDTTKTIDTTGPMTKQILSYKGDGELKTNSDAASILERYYFKDSDPGVDTLEEGQLGNELDAEPSKNINKTKKDMEKDIVESEEVEDADEEGGEEVKESDDLTEAEEAVIERLIAEMEGDDDADDSGDDDLDVEDEMTNEGDTSMDDDADGDDAGEEEAANEAALGPLGHPNDAESYENLEEAFQIFREEIEEDVIDIDEDDIEI